jgi:Na+/phosphate symporter
MWHWMVELAAGRLSTGQLIVTYLAEALIPFFILGLHGVQHPKGGWLSLLGAVLYGFAFVGFSATVLYPLVTGTRDADAVFDDFGAIYTSHAVLALIGGLVPPWFRVGPVTWLVSVR